MKGSLHPPGWWMLCPPLRSKHMPGYTVLSHAWLGSLGHEERCGSQGGVVQSVNQD